MDLRDLEYLLACVESGSFTGASRRVHAAQPTLSHAVKRLEDELGVTLLHRPKAKNERVVPTDAGEHVVATTRAIDALLRTLREDLSALDGTPRGELALGAAPSLAVSCVPEVLARARTETPGIRVALETASTDALVERVRDGSLDAAIVADVPPRARRGLVTEVLFEEPFVIVAATSLPLGRSATLREIAKGPLLLPSERVFHGRLIREAFRDAGAGPLEPVAILGSADALVAGARAGLGYAVLPIRTVEASDARLRVARIRGPKIVREVHLVVGRDASKRRVVEAFAAIVRETIGAARRRSGRNEREQRRA